MKTQKPLKKQNNNRKNINKVKVYSKKRSSSDSIDKIIKKLDSQLAEFTTSKIETFSQIPLSPATLKGLAECGYELPTEIQKESLLYSLKGLDILGAAKTGSGKTLAFLIPVLESLFKNKWTRLDGVGALVITPTRELAYQIFETLRKVGFYHDFSAGLIIGGKDLHFEKHRMDQVNIIICTPGRLLQHMDENPLFDCANMQILVLDEADRCLDLGFEKTMNSIIANLPPKHQTLLFSATQTKSVKDLARLSLNNPMYVSVHANAEHSTPESLKQSYVVCELHDKISMLWSFIKNHSRHKILVFLASCKQVKYMFEIMCKLRPPIALLALYGTLHQERRMKIYNSFASKKNVVLFATDVAARGLDFPEVHWVVQLDCPEDANTYIHRAGRTARLHKGGEALLVLLPSEKDAMLNNLEDKKIPINEIKVNPMMLINPHVKMEAFLARDPNLKASAQRAFVAYFKSVFLMKDKKVFNINALNPDTFARSLGLVVSPRIRFLQKYKQQLENSKNKVLTYENIKHEIVDSANPNEDVKLPLSNENIKDEIIDSDNPNEDVELQKVPKGKETYDFGGGDSDSNSDDDFLVVKRQNHLLEGVTSDEDEQKDLLNQMSRKSNKKLLTKAAIAKKVLKKKIIPNKKIVFTETGEMMEDKMKERTTEEGRQYEATGEGGIDIAEAKKVMRAEDKIDRKLFREKIKAKHRETRFKEKEKKIKNKKNNEDDIKVYSGSESDESGPDLSWLPDPDKVFGKEREDINSESEDEARETLANSSSEHNSESEVEEMESLNNSSSANKTKTSVKRKMKKRSPKDVKRLKVSPYYEDYGPVDTGLSLKEDEELVLKFLSNKS